MAKYLNPKVDLTFKKVFGEHPNLVKSLLNALLPLPEGMEIVKVEYLTPENVPENPTKKYSIVDVRCTDNKGRGFIVEMQSYWNREFFSRTIFNAASMYTKQLEKGNPFERLKEVYALALVNDE
ncbi:MAG: Rpn family recombination-promoting nuclease/putative transposase, partial [Bacteroidales bacterium]|nr:Rpn family recombination-promoting nuclease/putative transposase [Bacteroidales bacterium]